MTCEQTTVAGYPCSRPATWRAPDLRTGVVEHYCTQHANYYGIPRRKSATKLPRGK